MLINRWYQILNTLLLSQKISVQELCQKTGFSKHHIKTGIEMLNEQLNDVAIILQEDNQYQLVITNQEKFDLIMDGSLKGQTDYNSSSKRIAFVLKELVKKNYLFIDDLAEKTGVSRGTMNKDLKALREILKEYGVGVSGTPNKGLIIDGDEFSLRLLIIQHVFDYFPDAFTLSTEVETVLFQLCKKLNIEKANYALMRKSLLVSMWRINQKFPIESDFFFYYNRRIDANHLETFFYQVETDFEISLSKYERDFIQFPVYINHFSQIEIIAEDEARLEKIFNQMMRAVRKEYFVEIENYQLFQELKYHLMMMINRLLFHIQTSDIFLDEIVNTYPFAYKIAEVALNELGKIMGRIPPETEISYLAIYFELFLQKNLKAINKNVAIVSSASLGISTLIKQQVRDVIGTDVTIVHYTEEEARKSNFDSYYVVFSTIPLESQAPNTVVIRGTNLFNGSFLKSEWMKLSKGSSLSLSEQPIYFRKINKELQYFDNLNLIIDELEKNGKVDDDFRKRMLKRETDFSNLYQNGVAFPHTINYQSNEIILSVATSDESIKLMNDSIEVIIMLAIPEQMSEETETELLTLYDFIFRIMGDELIKQKLLKVNNRQELLRFFQVGGIF